MLTKRTEPQTSMRDLVKMTLRLRPDRIVVGEVRDGAALEVLKAWNTGHPGGLLTLHANSAADALPRLEDLAMEASAAPPTRLINAAVDMVVFIARTETGRIITEIVQHRL
jgi:type IV secretion system protein VirB11